MNLSSLPIVCIVTSCVNNESFFIIHCLHCKSLCEQCVFLHYPLFSL
ncbi:hypothetical protein KSS87_006517 [Heliosperma pusillum]|nr:hypothetical protein KSS87_006517 [Heliosperma pusillum]